ncbi:hypothetical protein [Kribbella yunnanensis]|uniref:hypothetical protein n=1 Tax=Kribbella yunnanensis TaxID=190194 RepID=UPI0031D31DC6
MLQFYAENHEEFTGNRDLASIRALHPELQSFDTWLDLHKDALKAALKGPLAASKPSRPPRIAPVVLVYSSVMFGRGFVMPPIQSMA